MGCSETFWKIDDFTRDMKENHSRWTVKGHKEAAKRARLISRELSKLHKRYRAESLAEITTEKAK